jgi:lipid-A-disaccharide synthase
MIEAFRRLQAKQNLRGRIVLPNERLRALSVDLVRGVPEVEVRAGDLAASLREATLAFASSGTVTLECAFFRVPTVVLYKTSWLTYQIARRIVRVRYIAMPNIIGDERIFPELIQNEVTADAIAAEALELLNNAARRQRIQSQLDAVVGALGAPGASRRAAKAILSLFC